VDDRRLVRDAVSEAAHGVLAQSEQLARPVGVVAERREPQVRARAGEHRRGDDTPPRACAGHALHRRKRVRMELLEKREQLGCDGFGQRPPRLERRAGELFLQRPVRRDLDIARRRIPELA
jgi:hypothetical protein